MKKQSKHLKFNEMISIVTVCYNSAETIEATLDSIESQDYHNKEHIVIDGASTDRTVEILRQHKSVSYFISEPDAGIYDAMNKGISLASGEIVGILNSDDIYVDSHVLSRVAEIFLDPSVDACYADLLYVKRDNTKKVVRYWKSREFKSGLFKLGWMPAHPTFFVRRKIYENLGKFDLNYEIAADFELLFRFMEVGKINTKYLPNILIKMRVGGTTNKSFANVLKQNLEIVRTLRSCYQNFSIIRFLANKILTRISQRFARPPFPGCQ